MPGVLDLLLQDGTRLGDNSEIIKGFSKIASMFAEDKMVTTESENIDSVKNIEQEISQMMNDKAHPYHIKGHPEHDKSIQQMLTMREMLNSNTK